MQKKCEMGKKKERTKWKRLWKAQYTFKPVSPLLFTSSFGLSEISFFLFSLLPNILFQFSWFSFSFFHFFVCFDTPKKSRGEAIYYLLGYFGKQRQQKHPKIKKERNKKAFSTCRMWTHKKPSKRIMRTFSKATRWLIHSLFLRLSQFSGFVCCFIFVASVITVSASSGYDSIECDPHSNRARTGRARLIASIPCDLTKQSYCNLPGEFYPW